jgi:hypothetical protein
MRRVVALIVVLAACSVVWWYFIVLLIRTSWFQHDITISNDAIQVMYLACGGTVAIATYVVLRRIVAGTLSYAILAAALIPTVGFSWMNLSETVCMSKEAGQCVPLFKYGLFFY